MTLFNSFLLFIRVFFSDEKNIDKRFFIAKKGLFYKTSYRIQQAQLNDVFVGVKFFYKSLFLIYSPYNNQGLFSQKGNYLIFDGDSKQKNDRLNYLSSVLRMDKSNFRYLALDKFSGVKSKAFKLKLTFFICVVFLIVFPFTVFSKNRALYALFLLSIIENILFLDLLLESGLNYVYYFFPFENDANFSALLLNQNNIEVHKVPGPNSLYHNHKYLLADKISFCSEFQFEQHEYLKKNWVVGQILKWPLYGYENLKPYFNTNDNQKPKPYKLGFISSGIWRREELGKIPVKNADFESEKKLIHLLVDYLSARKISTLYIYLHPIEKNNFEVYNKAISYYKNKFDNVECVFSEFDKSSYSSFNLVDTTIAAHSTSNLQRLFCGYKTMYALLDYETNMFEGTALQNISFNSKSEICTYLDQLINLPEKDYFNSNDLYLYNFNKYASFLN